MLRNARELKGLRLGARDGEIGRVKDFYFDDAHWAVRYLVADTGNWLSGRKVLISPVAVKGVHAIPHKALEVDLLKRQIEQSPSIDADQPVSRQFELQYHQHFDWPLYWDGPWLWGAAPYPGGWSPDSEASPPPVPKAAKPADPHLRSINEVTGYAIQALDQKFGHVHDFILDDQDWAIRYLVVDTKTWLPGKRVLLSPDWFAWVSWHEARAYVDLDRETVERAPGYEPGAPIDRSYEEQLFEHYGRPPYWSSSLANSQP